MLLAIFGVVGWVLKAMNEHVKHMAGHMDRIQDSFRQNVDLLVRNIDGLRQEVGGVRAELNKHTDKSGEIRESVIRRVRDLEKEMGDKNKKPTTRVDPVGRG